MSLKQLLSELQRKEIELWNDGERLRFAAPSGVMTPALLAQLRQHKEQIMSFLRQTSDEESQLAIPPTPRHGKLALSFAQQRLWFLDQLGDGGAYNIPLTLELRGALNVSILERTLQEIVQRHESLRTTFVETNGEAHQVIHTEVVVRLPVIDLSHLAPDGEASLAEKQASEVERLAAQEALHPFDLTKDLMLRGTLIKINKREGFDWHVLLLTMHHIASDGWSMGVLVREIKELYRAFSQGLPSPLPPLPIQYADFAVWQRQKLQGDVLTRQLEYWKSHLADAPPLHQLPTDRHRPAIDSFQGSVEHFTINHELTQQLHWLSQQTGSTLFMTLLAGFYVLMARYSGQEDIVVGTPIANRNRKEIEPLIGFFVNTLALRADLSGNPTFIQLLEQVRQTTQEAYDYQELPFESLVDALTLERHLNYNPVVQISFTLQNTPMATFELPGVQVSPLKLKVYAVSLDMDIQLFEEEGTLNGYWIYNSDLFDGSTIERMARHFQTLLASVVANPDQRITHLPLLSKSEKHQLLVEWNDTAADYPKDKCIHQLFEEQVKRTPEAVSVVFKDKKLTYHELNARANQLAMNLIAQGVGPDVLVGICIHRSLEMVIGLLAILKAGGAYVPLDPSYPEERRKFMLSDSGVQVLLTQRKFVDGLCPTLSVLCLDQDWELIEQEDDSNPQIIVKPNDLAYCIYTSGSTGKPKGTLIVHKALTNYLTWCHRTYPVTSGCGSPVNSSIGFDATITSLFSPLLAGKQVILLPEEEEIEALANVLHSQHNLSLVKITPAHLEILNQLWSRNSQYPYQCQAFIVGGEALFKKHLTFLQTHVPPIKMINEYGPTETVVGCCIYEVPGASALPNAIPIGRPIANTQLYILDRYQIPVPIGVPGELHIGGAGLARGYLNRPQLTAEKFITNPYGEGRLYKTGDLCRYLPDGNIEFLGRIDHQVKIRGFRIELGEIEAVLSQHPSVREAVVIVREDGALSSDKRLVAYLVNSEPVSQRDIRAYLGKKLPNYMIPSAFVQLEAMPLTPNGKINRQALPVPEYSSDEEEFVLPRTLTEESLAGIWQEVLGIEQAGVEDNFFEVGGHSLLATQVISRIRETFRLELPIRSLFENSTIASLAEYIDILKEAAMPTSEVTEDEEEEEW